MLTEEAYKQQVQMVVMAGGEFDFESARQMYGLGKLVKKVKNRQEDCKVTDR